MKTLGLFICACAASLAAAQTRDSLEEQRYWIQLQMRQLAGSASRVEMELAQRRHELFLRQQFVDKYNALVKALNEFHAVYQKDDGMTKPVDRIKAVKKAWRELKKADPAFDDSTDGTQGKP